MSPADMSVSPAFTAFAALVMVLFAGREAMARQERRFEGFWTYGIGTGSMMALLSKAARAEIEQVAVEIEKIETATEARFQELFVDAMGMTMTGYKVMQSLFS